MLFHRRTGSGCPALWIALAVAAVATTSPAQAAEPLSVERLFAEGWDIAGYTGTFDNRSSLILFRHKERRYLVQCSILYDVTRQQRVALNCYELH